MIQTNFDTKNFNAADTSTGTAGNTTSCSGLVDVAGSVGQISTNKLKLNGINYQTAPIRHPTTALNGGVRAKITVAGATLSPILQVHGQSNNAGVWAFINSTLLMTVATNMGTAGSFLAGKKTFSNGDYLLELSTQQIDTTHCLYTAKMLDATTSAVLDMYALSDATAALLNSSSLGVSGGLVNPCFVDDMVFFTLPAVLTQTLNITCTGHSLVAGSGSSAGHDCPTVMGAFLGSNVTIHNDGVSGNTIADLTARAAATDATLSATPGVVNVLHVDIGTNDMLASPGHNFTTVYNDLKTYCQARRAAGWTVIFVWCIQARSEAGLSGSWLTNALVLNSMLINNGVSDGFCNGVVQFDARFNPGSAETSSTTWFNGDHIHNNDDGYMQRAIYGSEMTRDYFNTPSPPAAGASHFTVPIGMGFGFGFD